jgi:hypothetical protein
MEAVHTAFLSRIFHVVFLPLEFGDTRPPIVKKF